MHSLEGNSKGLDKQSTCAKNPINCHSINYPKTQYSLPYRNMASDIFYTHINNFQFKTVSSSPLSLFYIKTQLTMYINLDKWNWLIE